jgi:tetratricopeptide (TPR) repeat protein
VRDLHRRGIEATGSGRPVAGTRLLQDALRLLGWPDRAAPPDKPGWAALTARVLLSLAVPEVYLGNSARSFDLLDAAESLVAPRDRGILVQQRGLILMLVGRMDEALRCLDEAIGLLAHTDELTVLARTLLNRGMLHQTVGRVRLALADLDQCERIATAESLPRLEAKAEHCRGSCHVLVGDIPAALRAFDTASRGYAEHADGWLAMVSVDKARALLAAGLHRDAVIELDAALRWFPAIRMSQEHAEAELTMAQAALAAKDLDSARMWARRAERRFRRRNNETWATLAVLTRLRAEFGLASQLARVATRAGEVALRLTKLGLDNDAESADLLAARAHIAGGRLDQARPHVRRRGGPGSVLETRLMRRLTLTELSAAAGDRGATLRHARAGSAMLRQRRSRFGSLDVQTGAASLGIELAERGLAAALAHGAPTMVFGWLERSRAQAFRIRSISPPADVATAHAVAELRQLAHRARMAELAGHPDPELRRRCGQLERQIRAHDWRADGSGEYHAEARYPEVCDELAGADSVLVSFLADGSRFRALTIADGHAELVGLGEVSAVSESAALLHGDLDALCGRRLPPALDEVVRASIRRQQAVLTENLLAPLRWTLRERDVVIVPTGVLSALPWGMLPDLRGRAVTVAPSASAWLTARRGTRLDGDRCLLVAGPNLDHAPDEVDRLARIYPNQTVLKGQKATVEATLRALERCSNVHFATHGHHERENVLFSRLDLIDGPLLAYDIHRLGRAPEHVVLSSCDVGQTIVRAGDEILGFTAALLYSGTRTVISSVARMDDNASVAVMAGYHRAVAAGTAPARALADAMTCEPLIPLVCFGSG